MKTKIWLALILALFLAGCAPVYAPYERPPYEAPPWYMYDGVPPLPVSPEAG